MNQPERWLKPDSRIKARMNIPGSAIQIDLMMQLFSQTTTTSATGGLALGDSPMAGSFASMLGGVADSNVDSAELSPLTIESPDYTKPAMPTKQLALICEQFPMCKFPTPDESELNQLHDTELDQAVPPSSASKPHQFNFDSLPLLGSDSDLALGKPFESTKLPYELLKDDVLGTANGSVLFGQVIPPMPALQNNQKQSDWHSNESSVQRLFADASASTSRPLELKATPEQPASESFAHFQHEPASSNRSIGSFKNPSVGNRSVDGGASSVWQTTGPAAFGSAERSTNARVTVDRQTSQLSQAPDRTGDVSVADKNVTDVESLEAITIGNNRTVPTEQPIESTSRQGQLPMSLAHPRFASQWTAPEPSHPGRDKGFDLQNETTDENASFATRRATPLESRSENRGNWETTETVESPLIPSSDVNRRNATTTDISGTQLASNLDATDSFNSDQFKIAANRGDSVTGETKNSSNKLNEPSNPQARFEGEEPSSGELVNVEIEAPPQLKSLPRFESHPKFQTNPKSSTHPQSVGNPVFDSNLELATDLKPVTYPQFPAPAEIEATAEIGERVVSRLPDIGTAAIDGLPVFEGITAAWFESTTSALNQTHVTSQVQAELQINPGRLTTKTRETGSPKKPGAGQTLHAESELDSSTTVSESSESSAVGVVHPVETAGAVPLAKFNQREFELHSQAVPALLAKKADEDHAKSGGREATKVDHKSPEFPKVAWHLPKVDAGRSSNLRAPDPEMVVESKRSITSNQDANQQFPFLSGLSSDHVATRELTQPAHRQIFLEAPVLEKIASQITEFVDADSGWVSLEIHPPELGRLDIMVSQKGNDLTAKIVAHEASTCDLLGHQKEELREMLAKQGMDLSNLDISHGRQSEDASNFGSRDRGSENRERLNFASHPTRVEVPKAERSIARSSGIDLLV